MLRRFSWIIDDLNGVSPSSWASEWWLQWTLLALHFYTNSMCIATLTWRRPNLSVIKELNLAEWSLNWANMLLQDWIMWSHQLILNVEHQNISYFFREDTTAPTCALMAPSIFNAIQVTCINHNLLRPLRIENMANIREKAPYKMIGILYPKL